MLRQISFQRNLIWFFELHVANVKKDSIKFTGRSCKHKQCLYNKCEVAKIGAAAASILSQNLEPQGFFIKALSKSEKDNE
jgi:hypothetical protein